MDLVRQILMQVEDADGPVYAEKLGFRDTSEECVLYHVQIMQQHGLVDAHINYRNGNVPYSGKVFGLTWDGHDFLDAVRDDKLWSRTKKTVKDVSGSITVETLKQTAIWLTELAIKSSIGM